jgi:glutamate 5-kinase
MVGLSSDAVQDTLGYRGRDEMVHRDDMVLHAAQSEKGQ